MASLNGPSTTAWLPSGPGILQRFDTGEGDNGVRRPPAIIRFPTAFLAIVFRVPGVGCQLSMPSPPRLNPRRPSRPTGRDHQIGQSAVKGHSGNNSNTRLSSWLIKFLERLARTNLLSAHIHILN